MKRDYFDDAEMHDDLLGDHISAAIRDRTSAFIEDVARNLGVEKHEIAFPTPYKVSQLALYYAMMTAALETSNMASNGDKDGVDAYELKRRTYKKLLDDLLAEITAETFTNGISATVNQFPLTVKIHRC